MSSTIRRIATPAVGVALVGGALLAGAAMPAQAATPAVNSSQAVAQARPQVRLAQPNRIVGPGQVAHYRITPGQMQEILQAHNFAQTPKARSIRNRESRGNYGVVSRSGYAGAYQFGRQTWVKMGGARFAPTANRAPVWAQDYIMWRTVRSHGWHPWGG